MTVVFTVGYEGTDIDRFVRTLKLCGVKILADVRAVPISRKKGFSKRRLQERLAEEGIAYEHFVDLGDPKPGRDAARSGAYAKFKKIYTTHLARSAPQEALTRLLSTVKRDQTCLLCFERDPCHCHRSIVAAGLEDAGVEIFHLYSDAPENYARNAAKLPGRHSRQSAAAAK